MLKRGSLVGAAHTVQARTATFPQIDVIVTQHAIVITTAAQISTILAALAGRDVSQTS